MDIELFLFVYGVIGYVLGMLAPELWFKLKNWRFWRNHTLEEILRKDRERR